MSASGHRASCSLVGLQRKSGGVVCFRWASLVTSICKARRWTPPHQHYPTRAFSCNKNSGCAFVISKLDYCNSLLSGCPQYIFDKIQKVQNSAARLVLKARNRNNVQPLLQKLYWLSVCSRVRYKLGTLCYNSFSEVFPVYLSDILTVNSAPQFQTTLFFGRHKNLPHSDHKNKQIWPEIFFTCCSCHLEFTAIRHPSLQVSACIHWRKPSRLIFSIFPNSKQLNHISLSVFIIFVYS